VDPPIQVLSLIGLSMLLFLAGLEIEFEHLRGRVLRLAGAGWILSFGIAVVAGLVLKATGFVETPLLVAIILAATSLGVIGAILTLIDRDRQMTHPQFRTKLEAVGFGVFIPVFFVASGIRFDLNALLDDLSNLAMVPIFLAALVVVRGLPALLYRNFAGDRRTVVAALFQSTSLPFIVAATAIGRELGLLGGAESAALIAAGLLSVLIFPLAGL